MGNHELFSQIAELIEQSELRTAKRIEELETRLSIKMENELTKGASMRFLTATS